MRRNCFLLCRLPLGMRLHSCTVEFQISTEPCLVIVLQRASWMNVLIPINRVFGLIDEDDDNVSYFLLPIIDDAFEKKSVPNYVMQIISSIWNCFTNSNKKNHKTSALEVFFGPWSLSLLICESQITYELAKINACICLYYHKTNCNEHHHDVTRHT